MTMQENQSNHDVRIISSLKCDGPVKIEPVTEKVSNVFAGAAPEKIRFVVSINNIQQYDVKSDLIDIDGSVLSTFVQTVYGATTVTVDLPDLSRRYGVFRVDVTVNDKNGKKVCFRRIPFSHVMEKSAPFRKCGCCIHQFYHDIPDTYHLIELMKTAGIYMVRDDFQWQFFETEKGNPVVPLNYQHTVGKLLDEGFELHPIFDHGNAFYGKNVGEVFSSEEGCAAYYELCRKTAEFYRGKIFHYEVWNEYNLTMVGTPEQYVKMLKIAYGAIKSVDENIRVTAGVTCSPHLAWVKAVMDAGAYDYFDEFSIHPYCAIPDWSYPDDTQGEYEQNVRDVSNIIAQYGEPKPVWVSEIGWTSGAVHTMVNREQQAACYTRLFAITESSDAVKRTIMYDLRDDSVDEFEMEYHWGLLETAGCTVPDAAKESYAAICALNHMIADAKPVKTDVTDKIKVITFDKKGKTVNILWSLDGAKKVTFSVDGEAELYDMYGNRLNVRQDGAGISLTVGESPIYMNGAAVTVENVENVPITYGTDYSMTCVPEYCGDEWYLKVIVRNHSERLNGRVRLELPEMNLAGNYALFDLAEGESFETKIRVTNPDVYKLYRALAEINLRNGFHEVKNELVSFMCVPYGKPQEMPYELHAQNDYVRIGGSEETPSLDARFGLGYDEENLYLIAEVEEETHVQYGTVRLDTWMDIWDGDGLELIVQPVVDGIRDTAKFNDIGFAMTSETGEIIPWRWRSVESRGYGRFRNCCLSVKRDGNVTRYSAAVPWSELLPPNVTLADCDSFGFALRVNFAESVTTSIDGYMQMYSGVGGWRTPYSYQPSQFGRFVLGKK